jgi:hypothetical protein
VGTRLRLGVRAELSTRAPSTVDCRPAPPLDESVSEEGGQGRARDGLALICAQIYADILRYTVTIEQ